MSGASVTLSSRRIGAMILRNWYLLRRSVPRLIDLFLWPMVNVLLWGFLSQFLAGNSSFVARAGGVLLAGMFLWDVMFRSQIGVAIGFLEEVWSRNLGHLFASPLRLRDYVGGLVGLSATRCLISVTPAFVVVYYLFDFSILKFGWSLPPYVVLLCINGWWYGLLVVSLLLRFGLAAEWLGWMSTWLLIPFMAPYYPVEILPQAFRIVSWAIPGTYVFESMKAQLATGEARFDYLGVALVLNLIYFAGAAFVFTRAFRGAKNSGGLLQMGE